MSSASAPTATSTAAQDKGETSAPPREKTAGQVKFEQIPWDRAVIEAGPSKDKKVPYARISNPDDGNKLIGQVMIPHSEKGDFVTIKNGIAFDKEIQDLVTKGGGRKMMETVTGEGGQPVIDPKTNKPAAKFVGLKFDIEKGDEIIGALEGAKSKKAGALVKALKAAKGVYDDQKKAIAKKW